MCFAKRIKMMAHKKNVRKKTVKGLSLLYAQCKAHTIQGLEIFNLAIVTNKCTNFQYVTMFNHQSGQIKR